MKDEHTELIIVKEHLRAAKADFADLEVRYKALFDYWNDRYPDEMGECLELLREPDPPKGGEDEKE